VRESWYRPASPRERRPPFRRSRVRHALEASLLVALVLMLRGPLHGEDRRYTIAFANLTEEPGVTLEGTGFTGADVRESFVLAARRYPIDLVLYDNHADRAKALANAEDAVARRVDLYIQYFRDPDVNALVGEKLKAARIPVLALNWPLPGAPLYTIDNLAAGQIAGEALGQFGERAWRGQAMIGVLIGNLKADEDRVPERARGVRAGMARYLPGLRITELDTQGNPAKVGPLLDKLLAPQPSTKILIAAMDDATALAAKSALESSGRLADAAIVSHGVDRSIHGGTSDRKEIDPTNRGSIVIGSVAFDLDRYGYDVLPIALKLARGEPVAARTVTRHRLVTPSNVWREYPPYDLQ
jgi:ribose transport system substrate-binding protein